MPSQAAKTRARNVRNAGSAAGKGHPSATLGASIWEPQSIAFFRQSPVPMWVYELETLRFVAVNDAAVELYGYSREEFLRMTIMDIRRAEERRRLQAHLTEPHP